MAGDLGSFEAIVADYRRTYDAAVREEARWFGAPGLTFEQAVDRAALSLAPSPLTGALVLHPHQRRLGHARMEAVAARLHAARVELRTAKSFHDLHGMVRANVSGIPGVGELAVYDIADRLGIHMGLGPERVYLHAGTRVGAGVLGVGWGRSSVSLSDLPSAFQALSPAEIEDVFCLYARDIERVAKGGGGFRRLSAARPRSVAAPRSGCGKRLAGKCSVVMDRAGNCL